MPTYVYLCNQCGEEFSRIMSLREFETAPVTCPKCSSGDVKQQITHFMTKTSRKS
jgi:putative FmdB family regulatory protein